VGRVAVAVEIDATPERVWEVVEPIEQHVEWMRDAVAIRFVGEQTRGVGTRFDCDTEVGPFHLVDHMEITEWVPYERIAVRHSGVVSGSGAFVIEPIDLGRRTRFSWTEELAFPWWLGGRLGELIGGSLVMKQIWRRNLHALELLVERGDSG